MLLYKRRQTFGIASIVARAPGAAPGSATAGAYTRDQMDGLRRREERRRLCLIFLLRRRRWFLEFTGACAGAGAKFSLACNYDRKGPGAGLMNSLKLSFFPIISSAFGIPYSEYGIPKANEIFRKKC